MMCRNYDRMTQERTEPDVQLIRAGSVKDEVPSACVTAADAGKGAALLTPVGAFQATATSPIVTDYTSHAVEDFDWNSGTPPSIACTVFYQRQLLSLKNSGPFVYDRAKVLATPPTVQATPPEYSLNRFWPGQFRVDYLNGPQDYVGVYVQSHYDGPTGLLTARTLKSISINQIEPKRATR